MILFEYYKLFMKTFLKNRDYRWITISDWVSVFGDAIFYLAMITYAATFAKSGASILLVTVFDLIPDTLSFFMGYLGDRTKHKLRADFFSAVGRAFLYIFVAAIFWTLEGWGALIVISIAKLISDLLGIYSDNLRFPEIYAVVPDEEYETSSGFGLAVYNLVDIIGRMFGGFALIFFQYQYGIFSIMNSLTFVICALCLLRVLKSVDSKLKKIEKVTEIEDKKDRDSLYNVFHTIISDKEEVDVLTYMMISNGVIAALLPVIYIFFSSQNISTEQYAVVVSILNSLCLAGSIIGSLVSGNLLKRVGLNLSLGLSGVAIICLVITQKLNLIIPLFIAYFVVYFFHGAIIIKFTVYQMKKQEFKNMGVSVGIINTILTVSSPVFLFIISGIGNLTHYKVSFDLILIISILFIAIMLYKKKKISQE